MALDIKSRFLIAAETTGQPAVDNLARSVGKVEQGVARIPQAARNAAAALAGIASAGAVAFLAATKASIDFSSAIVDASERTGLGIEAFQRLRFAFAQGGVSADEFASAMAKFSTQLGKAASGSKQQAEFFESMGINALEAVRSTQGLEGALFQFADQVQQAGSVQEAAALATEAFGRGVGVKLVAQLRGGSAGLRELGSEAGAAGAVLSETAARDAEALGQELENLEQVIRVQITEGLVELSPIIRDIGEGFAGAAKWVRDFYDAFNNPGGDEAIDHFAGLVREIRNLPLPFPVPVVGSLVSGAISAGQQQGDAAARAAAQQRFGTAGAPLGSLNILGNQGIARSVLDGALTPRRPRGGGGGGGGGVASAGASIDADPSIFPGSQRILDDIATEAREAERLRDVIADIDGALPALADEAGDSVAALWEANNDIAERALADLQDITDAAAQGIADTLEDGVFALFEEGADGMVDVFNRALQRMVLDLANSALKEELQRVFTDALQGSGGGGGSGFGSLFATILGAFAGGKTGTASVSKNASGGSFVVPGPNSGDRVIPIFRANGGEIVDISQPGKRRGGGGVQIVNNIDARGADPATEVRIRREIEASERRTIAQVANLARKGRL